MTLKEFKHDMIRGLGTCIIELKDSNEINKYKPVVLFGCLNVLSYEHQMEGTRSGYIYDLTQFFKDDSYFENAIIEKFNKNLRDSTLIISLIERLAQFAMSGSDNARQTLYAKYEKMIQRKNINDEDGILLDWLCVSLFHVSGYRFLKYHIRSMKQLKEVIKEDHLSWFYYNAQQKYKDKAVVLLKTIHPNYGRTPELPFEQKDFTFKNILNHLMDEDFYRRYSAFVYRTDDSEIKKAIDFLIDDLDLSKKQRLFRLLHKDITDYRIEDVIKMIGKYTLEIDESIYEYCSCVIENPITKKLGYSLLDNPSLRSFGLQMIIRNYTAQDKNSVIFYTKKLKIDYEDAGNWHNVFSMLIFLMDCKKKDLPEELLQYIFNETLTSFHRDMAIDVMKKRNMLSMEFLNVAQYDSDYDVSYKAKRILRRKFKETS